MKIKRKVVLHGLSTLTISLPANWTKKFNIKKGDELNVEEYDKELRINTEKSLSLGTKHLDIENLKRLGKTCVTASYRQGYDEIDLNYDDPNYINVIQSLISREITGFEIIKQSKNNCLIKDLTGHSRDEFNIVLRRIWLLLTDLSRESLNALKKNDRDALKNIEVMDYSINKFSNYCLRILIKKSQISFRKSPLYYYLIKSLEEMADQYKDLCKSYLENPRKIDNNLIVDFVKVNGYLSEVYGLFYKYEKNKIEELFKKTKLTSERISNSNNNLSICLSQICRKIRDLLSVLIEINL